MTRQRTALVILAAALAFIAAATLRPLPGTPTISATWCVICGDYGGTDFVLNIALFVPLGVGLGLSRIRRGAAVAAVVIATACIELVQFRFLAGRDASLGDVVANTLGGILGFAAIRYGASLLQPRPDLGRFLTFGYAAIWLALMTATSWLWTPHVVPLVYFSQWQPPHREFVPFRGQLLALGLNGHSLPPASMHELYGGAPPIWGGVDSVSADFRAGPPTPRLAPIARLGNRTADVFVLWRDRDRLAFRTRLRAADARFRLPIVALPGAFEDLSPSDTVRAVAGLRDGALYARLRKNTNTVSRAMPLSPGLAWSMLLPFNVALGTWSTLLSAVWIGASVVPMAFWGARADDAARQRRLVMLLVLLIAVLGLVALPPVLGAHAVGGWELVGLAAGLISGAYAATRRSQKFVRHS